MSEDQHATLVPIRHDAASEEETEYHFSDSDIFPSEGEAVILFVRPG